MNSRISPGVLDQLAPALMKGEVAQPQPERRLSLPWPVPPPSLPCAGSATAAAAVAAKPSGSVTVRLVWPCRSIDLQVVDTKPGTDRTCWVPPTNPTADNRPRSAARNRHVPPVPRPAANGGAQPRRCANSALKHADLQTAQPDLHRGYELWPSDQQRGYRRPAPTLCESPATIATRTTRSRGSAHWPKPLTYPHRYMARATHDDDWNQSRPHQNPVPDKRSRVGHSPRKSSAMKPLKHIKASPRRFQFVERLRRRPAWYYRSDQCPTPQAHDTTACWACACTLTGSLWRQALEVGKDAPLGHLQLKAAQGRFQFPSFRRRDLVRPREGLRLSNVATCAAKPDQELCGATDPYLSVVAQLGAR